MIFSTIFAEVRTFASLLTQLSGLAVAGSKRVRPESIVDGSVDHSRDVPGGFNDTSSAREYFAEVFRIHAQVELRRGRHPKIAIGASKFPKDFGGVRSECHRVGDAREWNKGYGDARILVWPPRLAGV
jgi:hypothetical protein